MTVKGLETILMVNDNFISITVAPPSKTTTPLSAAFMVLLLGLAISIPLCILPQRMPSLEDI